MIYIYIPLLSSAVLYLAEDENLPRWLCDLMTCNIAVENFDIQTTTIGIVMELIQLTRSIGSDDPDHSTVDHSPTGGTVSVMILPALLPRHLKYLNKNTVFYKVRLWHNYQSETWSSTRVDLYMAQIAKKGFARGYNVY